MNNQILLIYDFDKLFDILEELQNTFNFTIKKISKSNIDEINQKKSFELIVISKKKIPKITNQLLLDQFPIKISNLIEKINIEFIRLKFNKQSLVEIGKYNIDLNSRKMGFDQQLIKLTEKECEIIIYLSKSKKAVSINELEKNVWDYHSKLETHTVETHIYRLRKKIFKTFNDEGFILSVKNGYQIK